MKDILEYLAEVEQAYGTLLIDDQIPSLYLYQGVAYYSARGKQSEAEQSFLQAGKHFPKELYAWVNLGEIQTQVHTTTDLNTAHARTYTNITS